MSEEITQDDAISDDARETFLAAFKGFARDFLNREFPPGTAIDMHCTPEVVTVEVKFEGDVILAHEYRP